MITNSFIAIVALLAFVTPGNWRLGCYMWLAIAILQDPVRKVTVGTPAYLTIAFLPVYAAAMFGMMGTVQQSSVAHGLRRQFPRLQMPFQLFAISLAMSLLVAVGWTGHNLATAGLGVFSYAGGLPAVMLGYWFLRKNYGELEPLLIFFVIITSIMLIGVPLEQMGVRFSLPWLRTIGSDKVWYRWFNDYDYVAMISGFHRSPEIMGWHAMALTLICFYLNLCRPKWAWLWNLAAVWGVYACFMCGRRKMLMMMIAFMLAFYWSSTRENRRRIFTYAVVGAVLLIPAIAWSVDELYLLSLDSGVSTTGEKLSEKGLSGPLWLLSVVGPFGFGVGSLTQGVQHVSSHVSGIPLVEGGLEKVLVELGILGTLCALFFAGRLALTCHRCVTQSTIDQPLNCATAFCFSFVAANMAAFLIAFQFLGDPFINTFLGFMIGLLLSSRRLAACRIPQRDKNVPLASKAALCLSEH